MKQSNESNIMIIDSNQSIMHKSLKSPKSLFEIDKLLPMIEYIFNNIDKYPSLHDHIKRIVLNINLPGTDESLDTICENVVPSSYSQPSVQVIMSKPKVQITNENMDDFIIEKCEDMNNFLIVERVKNIDMIDTLPSLLKYKPFSNDVVLNSSSKSEITREGKVYFKIIIDKVISSQIIIYPFGTKVNTNKDKNIIDAYNLYGNIRMKIKNDEASGYAYGSWSSEGKIDKLNIVNIIKYELHEKNVQLKNIKLPLEIEFWNY